MKKSILFIVCVTCSVLAMAQSIPLGNNPNTFSSSGKSRSNLWYDQDVNTISFIHTSDPVITGDPNQYYYRCDVSLTGGNSWNNNLGPVYSNTNDKRGGFPLCVISNPTLGNSHDSAYIAYEGPWVNTAGSNSGRLYGVKPLVGTTHTQHIDNLSYSCFPENMFVTKHADEWMVGSMLSNDSINIYLDSILVTHGIWNSMNHDYTFTSKSIYVPVDPYLGNVTDMDIAFNDSGQIGYIAMITKLNILFFPDSVLYLSVLETGDAGQSWHYANFSGPLNPEIVDVSHSLDTMLGNNSAYVYGIASDLDIVVDAYSDLHILTAITPSRNYEVSPDDIPRQWGMFDIHSVNGGQSWKAKLLAKPATFRGTFGDGSPANPLLDEGNRPFASRSWDGSKLFFSWFDTDTIAYGLDPNFPRHNNRSPDLYTIGYDVNNNTWTDKINLTAGTDADGSCRFGNGSYYAIDSANLGIVFSIPMVYQKFHLDDPVQTGSPTTFWYFPNANVDMNSATHPDNSVYLLPYIGSVHEIENSQTLVVSSNYPNPFNGKTSFDITLAKASDVTVEIINMPGEVLSMNKYSNLASGLHTLSIEGNKLAAGIYMYKVKAGDKTVTRKMVVL